MATVHFIPSRLLPVAALLVMSALQALIAAACDSELAVAPTATSTVEATQVHEATQVQSATATVLVEPATAVVATSGSELTAIANSTESPVATPTTLTPSATPGQSAVQTPTAPLGATASPAGTPGALTVEHSAAVRADNALIVDLRIEFSAPLDYYVEYGNEDVGWLKTPRAERFGKQYESALVRLRADMDYQYEVFGINRVDQVVVKSSGTFRTGKLPDALSAMKFTQEGKPTSQITMFDAETANEEFLFAVDRESNIIWYWFAPATGQGIESFRRGLQGIKQRPNYNLVFLSKIDGLFEMTPDTRVVEQLELSSNIPPQETPDEGDASGYEGIGEIGPHHDLEILDKNRVLYLDKENRLYDDTANGGPSNLIVAGDRLMVWDILAKTTTEVWNSFDFLSPVDRVKWRLVYRGGAQRPWADWTHANSVSIGTTDNILVSNRHMNQVISIAPDFGEIEWKLGGPGSDFTFPELKDQFYHQHSAYQLSNGNILVFDNGNERPHAEGGEYSRALELKLDFEAMTATKVWEFRPKPDHYAFKKSNVVRLANGNTLVAFGAPDTEPMLTMEANKKGEEVWRHTFWSPTLIEHYRSQAFASLKGEIPVKR